MSKTSNTPVRKTHRQFYTELLSNPTLTAEQVEFIKGRIEALDKKNTNSGEKKLTERQIANNAIKTAIVEAMEPNRLYTVSEIIKEVPACAGLYTQRVSPMLNGLADEGKIIKSVEKGRSYFALPSVED